jgi:DNA-binding transcriptional ArsR family regulator
MKEGPDVSIVAALIGDPGRANMLMALMSGLSLTATELAQEAGITASTASGHLGKLERAGLITTKRQGRHRYFRLADPDVAVAVEGLVPVAARIGHLRTRPGPRDEAMREARSCYDHLAGRLAVALFEHWASSRILEIKNTDAGLTPKGRLVLTRLGLDIASLERNKRPLCRTCVDWSERQAHLGGSLGAAIMEHVMRRGWAVREGRTRVLRFSRKGRENFVRWYRAEERVAPVAAMASSVIAKRHSKRL